MLEYHHLKIKYQKQKNNMENNLSLSVILPLKSALAKDFDIYFDRAIKSIVSSTVKPKELIIVHTQEENLKTFLSDYDFSGLTVNKYEYVGEANYSSQVNLGVSKSNEEWVSFFEFDDEYSPIWFSNVKKYATYYPEVKGFLPVVVDIDEKSVFAGFTNEATFAANFTQEIGYLTNEVLLEYQNFQSAGAAFKKSVIEDFGGFKPSMKLTFIYEFLLRLTYNSASIMTIPKIGYKHMNLREGSIFWNYKNGTDKMLEDEVKFWIETAKKEHFFVTDRSIKYEPQTT
jgi:hypothetical protein